MHNTQTAPPEAPAAPIPALDTAWPEESPPQRQQLLLPDSFSATLPRSHPALSNPISSTSLSHTLLADDIAGLSLLAAPSADARDAPAATAAQRKPRPAVAALNTSLLPKGDTASRATNRPSAIRVDERDAPESPALQLLNRSLAACAAAGSRNNNSSLSGTPKTSRSNSTAGTPRNTGTPRSVRFAEHVGVLSIPKDHASPLMKHEERRVPLFDKERRNSFAKEPELISLEPYECPDDGHPIVF